MSGFFAEISSLLPQVRDGFSQSPSQTTQAIDRLDELLEDLREGAEVVIFQQFTEYLQEWLPNVRLLQFEGTRSPKRSYPLLSELARSILAVKNALVELQSVNQSDEAMAVLTDGDERQRREEEK